MKLSAMLESLLFVAADPVTPAQLAQTTGCPEAEVTKLTSLDELPDLPPVETATPAS